MLTSQRLTVLIGALVIALTGAAVGIFLAERGGADTVQPARAQEIGQDRGISVRGEGQVTMVPDVARVTVGVEVEGEDVGALREDADSRMNAVIDALQDAGIAEEDIRTISYDLTVQRDDRHPPEPFEEEPARETEDDPAPDEPATDEADVQEETTVEEGTESYRLTQLVQVTVRDIDEVGNIIDLALDEGANRVGSIYFEVDDRTTAIEQARERAVEDALSKGQHLAELSGVNLGAPIKIEEHSPSAPPVRMEEMAVAEDMADGAEARIEPGESVITVNVNIVYAIE